HGSHRGTNHSGRSPAIDATAPASCRDRRRRERYRRPRVRPPRRGFAEERRLPKYSPYGAVGKTFCAYRRFPYAGSLGRKLTYVPDIARIRHRSGGIIFAFRIKGPSKINGPTSRRNMASSSVTDRSG